jgi:EAL domain-containing protein (putative c-di-GMP-specific phosphodiesterase class I)
VKPRRDDSTPKAQIQSYIDDRAFALAYQPIVNLDTGTITGVEALCRFADGTSTERRFRQSERLGLAAELDLVIIERVLADIPQVPDGYVSINLSPSTVLDPRLGDRLLASDVPADRVVIEVTEHARVPDYERADQMLAAVRRSGIRLAVDDAGAGYATFRHILRLRPDMIKMDRSITQDIDADAARQALATALAIFGGEIGATVIAEGAETGHEIAAVRRAGISQAQGFALAPPAALPLPALDYRPPAVETRGSPPPSHGEALRRLDDAVETFRAAQSQLEDTVSLSRVAGATWDEIGQLLGMTRQGAAQRYREDRAR